MKKLIEILPSYTYTYSVNKKPIRSANGYLTTLLRWPVNDDLANIYGFQSIKSTL